MEDMDHIDQLIDQYLLTEFNLQPADVAMILAINDNIKNTDVDNYLTKKENPKLKNLQPRFGKTKLPLDKLLSMDIAMAAMEEVQERKLKQGIIVAGILENYTNLMILCHNDPEKREATRREAVKFIEHEMDRLCMSDDDFSRLILAYHTFRDYQNDQDKNQDKGQTTQGQEMA